MTTTASQFSMEYAENIVETDCNAGRDRGSPFAGGNNRAAKAGGHFERADFNHQG